MKFLCGSCRTKYQIADDKLQGKILTIRCKKCGAKILVRESLKREAGPGTAVAPVAEEAHQEELRNELRSDGRLRSAQGAGAAAFSSAFDVSMGSGHGTDDMPTSIAPVPVNLDNAGIEWYVAIDGQQHGPFAFAEVVRRIRGGDVLGRHYAWHEGMDNWQRIRDVADLSVHLPESAPRRGPPPPPPVGPPGPPPVSGVSAAEAANVVDFASRRAERARRTGDIPREGEREMARPHSGGEASFDPRESATEIAAERLAGPDRSSMDRPGVEGSAERGFFGPQDEEPTLGAAAQAAAAGAGAAAVASLSPEGTHKALDLHFDRADDIFANVPRASDADMVPRESTRFFVAAAGVNKRRSQQKLWLGIGVVASLCFAGLLGAWATGIVQISLPGIGNPFANARGTEEEEALATGGGPIDYDALVESRKATTKRRASRGRRVLDPNGNPTYIDDAPSDVAENRRDVDDLGPVGIDMATGAHQIPGSVGHIQLPEADPELPPVEEASLSEETIAKVVKAKSRSVLICYQQSLRANESLRGKLEIRVTIQPTGRVSRADVETTAFRGSKIGRCIADKVKDWRFPSFAGQSQDVVLPFILEKQAY